MTHTRYLHDIPSIREGLESLIVKDPVFSEHVTEISDFHWQAYPKGFEGLARIITGQQVSVRAADALWETLKSQVVPFTTSRFLELSADSGRELGLSRQKYSYLRGLAFAIQDNDLDPKSLESLADQEIYDRLTVIKGVGPWSAQMYMIFSLQRPDIWLPADLGIQKGTQIYLSSSERPDHKRTDETGDLFYPYRTAACLLLWHMASKADLPTK